MRLFRFWTKERCLEYIDELEKAVALGSKTTSFQGQTTAWSSLAEIKEILGQLYARVDELDGTKGSHNPKAGISWIRVIPERGY